MLSVDMLAEPVGHVGRESSHSEGSQLDQEQIDRFADVAADRSWY